MYTILGPCRRYLLLNRPELWLMRLQYVVPAGMVAVAGAWCLGWAFSSKPGRVADPAFYFGWFLAASSTASLYWVYLQVRQQTAFSFQPSARGWSAFYLNVLLLVFINTTPFVLAWQISLRIAPSPEITAALRRARDAENHYNVARYSVTESRFLKRVVSGDLSAEDRAALAGVKAEKVKMEAANASLETIAGGIYLPEERAILLRETDTASWRMFSYVCFYVVLEIALFISLVRVFSFAFVTTALLAIAGGVLIVIVGLQITANQSHLAPGALLLAYGFTMAVLLQGIVRERSSMLTRAGIVAWLVGTPFAPLLAVLTATVYYVDWVDRIGRIDRNDRALPVEHGLLGGAILFLAIWPIIQRCLNRFQSLPK